MFQLINNRELEVTFDVSGASDSFPSVAFDIQVKWNMPYQSVNVVNKESWFSCADLDSFETNLRVLVTKESGTVTLSNLSREPMISFIKSGSELKN